MKTKILLFGLLFCGFTLKAQQKIKTDSVLTPKSIYFVTDVNKSLDTTPQSIISVNAKNTDYKEVSIPLKNIHKIPPYLYSNYRDKKILTEITRKNPINWTLRDRYPKNGPLSISK